MPIVDHKEARARAQAAFKQLRDEFYAGKEDVVVDEE
jgi:hypothetical protein